jgi:four helix bundle protein
MKDFRQLKIWQQAHGVTLRVYAITKAFPREERLGLMSQIRRCSASMGANIAEGCAKGGNGEFQRFLNIAAGSAANSITTIVGL